MKKQLNSFDSDRQITRKSYRRSHVAARSVAPGSVPPGLADSLAHRQDTMTGTTDWMTKLWTSLLDSCSKCHGLEQENMLTVVLMPLFTSLWSWAPALLPCFAVKRNAYFAVRQVFCPFNSVVEVLFSCLLVLFALPFPQAVQQVERKRRRREQRRKMTPSLRRRNLDSSMIWRANWTNLYQAEMSAKNGKEKNLIDKRTDEGREMHMCMR